MVSLTQVNHSAHDRRFIKELLTDRSITIKPADKNLGLAFVDTSWYNSELKRMLSDTITYKPCQNITDTNGTLIRFSVDELKIKLLVQLKSIADRYRSTLMEWNSEQAEQIGKYLSQKINKESSSVPNIYLLIKVHKPKGLCGRPIVPCTRWITTPASVLADHLLQEIMRKANIYWLIKDTKSLVNDIEQTILPSSDGIFVTADIASLYTNIDTKLGLNLVREFLSEQKVNEDLAKLIMELIEFVMLNSYLSHQGRIFHQIDGTAMGTAAAPTYANIVVYMLERSIVKEFSERGALHFYRRFLDDLFAFIKAADAADFILRMNSLHPNSFPIRTKRLSWIYQSIRESDSNHKRSLIIECIKRR
jgi:hypothetical protein